MVKADRIPPDFDDSSVNIGLGSLLSQYQNQVPFQRWKANNANFTRVFQALKKYAYRPFASGETAIIDTRTYFYLRGFLEAAQREGRTVALTSTWMHSISEDNQTYPNVAMPFFLNNVDLTVGANVIYSITATLLTGLTGSAAQSQALWFDQDLQTIYENTTSLIAWMINSNFSGRPDFALTYYPSIYNFYWFTSRTLNLLQTYNGSKHSLPHPSLSRVMAVLTAALRGNATQDLLKRAKTDKDGLVYFEDFLGNADKNVEGMKNTLLSEHLYTSLSLFPGKTVKHGEDRVCSTAMAINTLLYTWMVGNQLMLDTPKPVVDVVKNASLWLVKNAKKGKPYNVFFSGSVKLGEVCTTEKLLIFDVISLSHSLSLSLSAGSAVLLPCKCTDVYEWNNCPTRDTLWLRNHCRDALCDP